MPAICNVIAHESFNEYFIGSYLASSFTTIKGHLDAISTCAYHLSHAALNENNQLVFSPTGIANNCDLYDIPTAFVYCVGHLVSTPA